MPNATVTLTSASTNTSTAVNLNWLGGSPTTVSVTAASATSSGAFNIQFTLDDLQRVSSGSVVWTKLSSAIGQAGTIYNASNSFPDGIVISFLNPIAAVRLISTATNNVNSGPITMKVLQGEGA